MDSIRIWLLSHKLKATIRAMDETRYDFGDNWYDFIGDLSREQRDIARNELRALVGDLKGKRFVDIGSGSGLHSLAALDLGAASVTAMDYDPMSVKSTQTLLSRHAEGKNWVARQGDILASPTDGDTFDVVYSWGVLHHTGNMWRAIENASKLCRSGGVFAIALYNKTTFCPFWKAEKRIYSKYTVLRPVLDGLFIAALLLRQVLTGTNPVRYIQDYKTNRGMNFFTDIRDWLGGYPYESVADKELVSRMEKNGFSLVKRNNVSQSLGLFGSGCGEWVFQRTG